MSRHVHEMRLLLVSAVSEIMTRHDKAFSLSLFEFSTLIFSQLKRPYNHHKRASTSVFSYKLAIGECFG
jgi:hypothetical protein